MLLFDNNMSLYLNAADYNCCQKIALTGSRERTG